MTTINLMDRELHALKVRMPENSNTQKTFGLRSFFRTKFIEWQLALLLSFLLTIWFLTSLWLEAIDPSAVILAQNMWLFVILGLIAFLLVLALSLWLLHLFWRKMRLPPVSIMVSQFKTLALWQQLSFYFACFALLLLAASACLIAIC